MKESIEDHTFFEAIKEYILARKNLLLLKAAETASYVIATSILILVISAFAIVGLLFLGVSAAFLIAEISGSNATGFFVVAIFYFIVTLFLILIRKNGLRKPLMNIFIKRFFK